MVPYFTALSAASSPSFKVSYHANEANSCQSMSGTRVVIPTARQEARLLRRASRAWQDGMSEACGRYQMSVLSARSFRSNLQKASRRLVTAEGRSLRVNRQRVGMCSGERKTHSSIYYGQCFEPSTNCTPSRPQDPIRRFRNRKGRSRESIG